MVKQILVAFGALKLHFSSAGKDISDTVDKGLSLPLSLCSSPARYFQASNMVVKEYVLENE